MNVHELKKQQWDKFYETKSYISNTSVNLILNYHNLSWPKKLVIMDIGVGQGDFIKSLSKDNIMIGVDVSQKALDTVKPFCKNVYFSKDLKEIEDVDLAICNLVMQHNHEYEVARIINDVNIKKDGILSFQFASLNEEKSTLTPKTIKNLNNGMYYFYSPKKMASIVDSTNKKVLKIFGPYWFGNDHNFDWNIFHVVKK